MKSKELREFDVFVSSIKKNTFSLSKNIEIVSGFLETKINEQIQSKDELVQILNEYRKFYKSNKRQTLYHSNLK